MNKNFELAQKNLDEIVANRRYLHRIPGRGFDVDATYEFVWNKLVEYGYEPKKCGRAGIVAVVGKPGKTILLRADMDGLLMKENTGLEFSSETDCTHACGHDMHAAMLLGAAKILKERERELKGCVKLAFQPAEELLQGCADMIENGLMENPKVDAAYAQHVWVNDDNVKVGDYKVIVPFATMAGDIVQLYVHGKAAHSSAPNKGIDANAAGCRIFNGMEEIISAEVPREVPNVICGIIKGGTASNVVSDECFMQFGTRCGDPKVRHYVLERMEEIAKYMGKAYRCDVDFIHYAGSSPIVNDEELVKELLGYVGDIIPPEHIRVETERSSIGEDFGNVMELVPSMFGMIGAGSPSEGMCGALHQPETVFSEDILAKGAAIPAEIAMSWLANHCE